MLSIEEELFKLFAKALEQAYPDIMDVPVVIAIAGNPKFGDYQFNSAMAISKMLNAQGKSHLIVYQISSTKL